MWAFVTTFSSVFYMSCKVYIFQVWLKCPEFHGDGDVGEAGVI